MKYNIKNIGNCEYYYRFEWDGIIRAYPKVNYNAKGAWLDFFRFCRNYNY